MAAIDQVVAALPATHIQTLDAYDNPAIGEAGWRALADALPSLPQKSWRYLMKAWTRGSQSVARSQVCQRTPDSTRVGAPAFRTWILAP